MRETIDLPGGADPIKQMEAHLDRQREREREVRRAEWAKELLLKLVETSGADARTSYDMRINVRAAVEYTDALLAELEKEK